MKPLTVGMGLIFSSLLFLGAAIGSDKPHWTYTGEEGPEHWGELDPSYAACKDGKNQSPVDISDTIDAKLPPLSIAYPAGGTEVLNNGHTIQVVYAPGSTLTLAGRTFQLKQFHFHTPSENTIGGKSFPMEAHLVHADADGNLAVMGVMFEEGAANTELEKAWKVMPEKADEKNPLPTKLEVRRMLPKKLDYYRFSGSLTTPPCTEGVIWLVMKAPVTASKEQIERFVHVMHHPNNRPVQPVGARVILH